METAKITEVSDYNKEWSFTPPGKSPVTLVTYYCKSNEFDGVIEVNKKLGNSGPLVGDILEGTFIKTEYVDKQGNDHFKFKATPRFSAPSVDLSSVYEKLDEILALLKMDAKKPSEELVDPFAVAEVKGDEEIDLDSIPF